MNIQELKKEAERLNDDINYVGWHTPEGDDLYGQLLQVQKQIKHEENKLMLEALDNANRLDWA